MFRMLLQIAALMACLVMGAGYWYLWYELIGYLLPTLGSVSNIGLTLLIHAVVIVISFKVSTND